MSIFSELIFLQGYVTRPALLRQEEQVPAPAPAPRASPRPQLRAVAAVPGASAVGGCA